MMGMYEFPPHVERALAHLKISPKKPNGISSASNLIAVEKFINKCKQNNNIATLDNILKPSKQDEHHLVDHLHFLLSSCGVSLEPASIPFFSHPTTTTAQQQQTHNQQQYHQTNYNNNNNNMMMAGHHHQYYYPHQQQQQPYNYYRTHNTNNNSIYPYHPQHAPYHYYGHPGAMMIAVPPPATGAMYAAHHANQGSSCSSTLPHHASSSSTLLSSVSTSNGASYMSSDPVASLKRPQNTVTSSTTDNLHATYPDFFHYNN